MKSTGIIKSQTKVCVCVCARLCVCCFHTLTAWFLCEEHNKNKFNLAWATSTRAWKPTFIHTIREDAAREEVTSVQSAPRRQLHRSSAKPLRNWGIPVAREIQMTLENGSNYRKALKIIKIHNSSPYFSQTQTVRVLKYTFIFFFIFKKNKTKQRRLTLLVSL